MELERAEYLNNIFGYLWLFFHWYYTKIWLRSFKIFNYYGESEIINKLTLWH
jgi:hypothetical protein